TDVTPFFTTATISCGRSIATRFWKEPCGSGFGRSSSKYARNWACRSYQGFCRERISTCSSRYRRTLRAEISYAGLRAGPRIAFRWSSPNFVSATGDATSGPGATSAPQAATSQTMSYFSIFVRTNLQAPAGSCSVPSLPVLVYAEERLRTLMSPPFPRGAGFSCLGLPNRRERLQELLIIIVQDYRSLS